MGSPAVVDRIDHIELFVSDWDEAASWYERVLGLVVDERFERWWTEGQGPLVLSVDEEGAKLALFEREVATRSGAISPRRVAFRTDGEGFLSFLDRVAGLDLTDQQGEPVAATATDHGLAYSIYFTDPDGNALELTTYETKIVSAGLRDRT